MPELNLVSIGTLVILIGFALIFAGTLMQTKGKTKVEGGGVILIGPLPIIGATSERMLYMVLAITMIFFFVFILLNYLR